VKLKSLKLVMLNEELSLLSPAAQVASAESGTQVNSSLEVRRNRMVRVGLYYA